jgi:hypothetical protein
MSLYTGLFEMIVGVLTTCHTPRSPDATPCDFFLWGYVKDQVYVPPLPASIPELKVGIRTAIETISADMLQVVLQPATRALLKTSHAKSPTHNELRKRRPMW